MKKLILFLLFAPLSIFAQNIDSLGNDTKELWGTRAKNNDTIYYWYSNIMFHLKNTYSTINGKIFTLASENKNDIQNKLFENINDFVFVGAYHSSIEPIYDIPNIQTDHFYNSGAWIKNESFIVINGVKIYAAKNDKDAEKKGVKIGEMYICDDVLNIAIYRHIVIRVQ